MRLSLAVAAIIAIAGIAYAMWPAAEESVKTSSSENTGGEAIAEVLLPESYSPNATIGKLAFEAKCAACHGTNASGKRGVAPPLVHKIYEPSHHGDEAFQRAAALGVKSHHWPFGNMPPVVGITRGDVKMIVFYVRELQIANGIK